jgi:hypothetical protein
VQFGQLANCTLMVVGAWVEPEPTVEVKGEVAVDEVTTAGLDCATVVVTGAAELLEDGVAAVPSVGLAVEGGAVATGVLVPAERPAPPVGPSCGTVTTRARPALDVLETDDLVTAADVADGPELPSVQPVSVRAASAPVTSIPVRDRLRNDVQTGMHLSYTTARSQPGKPPVRRGEFSHGA